MIMQGFMFINSDLSELDANGMFGFFSVEEEGSKWSNDSFTMHVIEILNFIRHASLSAL